MQNKLKITKILLVLGGFYYLIGSIVHFFGVTLFPWYDGALFAPYHDIVISLASITLSGIFFVISRDPEKYKEIINFLIFASFIAILFSIYIIFKVDFVILGSSLKKTQTIFEMILLFIYLSLLIFSMPQRLSAEY